MEATMEQLQGDAVSIVSQNDLDQDNYKISCDGKVCRICLATGGEMHSMIDSKKLNKTYEILTGILTADDELLPRYLCAECAEQLMKCALLRFRSLQTHLTLLDIVKRHGRITVELLRSIAINNTSKLFDYPNDDHFDVGDEELKEVNEVTDARSKTRVEDIDICKNINDMPKVDDISDHSQINSDEDRADMIDVNYIKTENDDWSNQDLSAGLSNVKIEIMLDNDTNRDDLSLSSFNVMNETADVNIENDGVTNQDVNEVTSNNSAMYTVGRYDVTVNNVMKMEYIDVAEVGSVKVETPFSDCMELPSRMSVGEDVGDPLRIQTKKGTETLQDLKMNTDIQKALEGGGEKPYSCVCKIAFKFKHELESHLIAAHSDANLYSCDVCKENFKKKNDLKSHLVKIHPWRKPYSCDICKKVFKKQYELKAHSIMHSDEKPYSCPVCKKALRRKGQLRLHYLSQHSNEKPYSCNICKKCFIDKRGLKLHSKWHSVERPYSCHICNKTFKCKYSLRPHLITHTDERPYSCHICKKAFKCRSSLRSHLRRHSGKKPYSCAICEKTFYHRTRLEKHAPIHSDEKPYTCVVCKKILKTKSTLQSHVRTHFDDKTYSCDFCQKKFRQKRLLASHLLRDACSQ